MDRKQSSILIVMIALCIWGSQIDPKPEWRAVGLVGAAILFILWLDLRLK